MRDWIRVAAGALGGAFLAVLIVFAAARVGMLPGVGPDGIRTYLLGHPELLAEMSAKLQSQQDAADRAKAADAMKKIGMAAFFDPRIAFISGPADAKKTVVEFYDFNCPYCRLSLPAMQKFYREHQKDTRFAFILFPIRGPDSILAARAALAAREQGKYMELYATLMGEDEPVDEAMIYADAQKVGLDIAKLKADMQKPEIDVAIAASKALAARAGIDGTPTFIINGNIHPGAVDDDTLKSLTAES